MTASRNLLLDEPCFSLMPRAWRLSLAFNHVFNLMIAKDRFVRLTNRKDLQNQTLELLQ